MSLTGFSPLASNSRKLHTWEIPPEGGTRLRLRNGSGGFLLVHLATRFDKRVEDIDRNYLNGQLDDWGYAFRPVRGYASLSRHAYGLAEDLNATEHPLGATHTFSQKEVAFIHHMLKMYEGCIRWGGDYRGRKDPMHFEINRPLRDCERVARKLVDTPNGKRILKLNPGQRKVIFS